MMTSLRHPLFTLNQILEKHSHSIIWTSTTLLGLAILNFFLSSLSLVFNESTALATAYFKFIEHFFLESLIWSLAFSLVGFVGIMSSLKYFVHSYSTTAVQNSPKSEKVIKGITLNTLAEGYKKSGKYDKALPLYKQSLSILEKELGHNHPDVATATNNLAGIHYIKGEYETAQSLYKKVLAIQEQTLGKQHPDYATTLNNLAVLYDSQGNYAQALPLSQTALNILQKNWGTQHPAYATSLNNLAGLYYSQRELDKALPLYQQALAIRERVLGKQHPDYASSLNNLAEVYRAQGQCAQALPLYQEALHIMHQVWGKRHPTTQRIQENYKRCQQQV